MSEPTLAELASAALPVVAKEVESALAPEAVKVLGDLREFVSGEADKLRTEFPAVVEQGVAHLHNLAEAMLSRYHSVMERIDAHLGGATPVPTQSVASSPDQSASSASATGVSSPPAATQPQASPEPLPSTSEASSTPETSPDSSATPSAIAQAVTPVI